MWEIIKAAGWPIWPLILASIIAVAIIIERFWALRTDIIAPKNLLPEVQKWLSKGGVTKETCARLEQHSLLGEIFASARDNIDSSREVMKEAIEESGRAVLHHLGQSADVRGHHRNLGTHRFEGDQAEALRGAGQ